MASLVIVINGYVLLDFFLSEVNALLIGLLVFTGSSDYVAFFLYLISYGGGFRSSWFRLNTLQVCKEELVSQQNLHLEFEEASK